MRRVSIGAPPLVAPLLLALAACGGAGQTQPLTPFTFGRFDVVTWEAKPLPDTLRVLVGVSTTPGSSATSRCPEVLTGATLDIASDNAITRTSHLTYPCTGTLPSDMPDTLTRVETGHVTVAGSNVTLTFGADTPGVSSSTVEYAHVHGGDIVVDEIHSGMNLGSVELLANARVYRRE